jgi:RNA recognition motif-containing protein
MATIFALAEPARTRIIRVTNVHFDAGEKELKELFSDFTIEDYFRPVNTRTSKNSIVYVLFANVAERIRACNKTGLEFLGRTIKIQPAPTGNYERK